MPRNMSFALTTEQIRNRTKTVTRRIGWDNLWKGDEFWAVVKCQGLKKGEKVERLALLRCVSNHRELLESITADEVEREGFPGMSPADFVKMFCDHMKVWPRLYVNRIEFEYLVEHKPC